ncbi:MAG: OB-fold nucleic acid binding domain-containing protein [Candidatus Pacearchaeota archaeon]
MANDFKRHTAYKVRIGDLFKAKQIIDNNRFLYLELNDKKIFRVNIVANVIEKFSSDEKKYLSFVIDDASGQIRIKVFEDDFEKFSSISQGDTIVVIGLVRSYNNELYISPEIIKIQDPRYLMVRKLELEKQKTKTIEKKDILALSDEINQKIKNSEPNGINIENLILEINAPPELINQEIKKALEQGIIYEPRPGVLRWLGE